MRSLRVVPYVAQKRTVSIRTKYTNRMAGLRLNSEITKYIENFRKFEKFLCHRVQRRKYFNSSLLRKKVFEKRFVCRPGTTELRTNALTTIRRTTFFF